MQRLVEHLSGTLSTTSIPQPRLRFRAALTACIAAIGLMMGSTCSPPPNPGNNVDSFSLWSSGTKLRGANIYQRRVYPAIDGTTFIGPGPIGPPYTQADLNALAAAGANCVNISHPGLFSETPPYQPDTAVQANLDDLLDMANDAGLWAVISFRTGPGRSEFAIFEGQTWFPQSLVNNQIWKEQAAQDAWAAMWKYTAQRYAQTAHVVGYDLMVEPNSASVIHGVFDPASFYPKYANTLTDWNRMYPKVLAAIREVDTSTPVLVSAMQYGSVDWLPYLTTSADARSVYIVHHYEPFTYSHQEANQSIQYPGTMNVDGVVTLVNKPWLEQRLANIDSFRSTHNVPVAITEYGVSRWSPNAAQYVTDQLSLIEARGLNHAIWLWESSYSGVAEADQFNFRHGPVPANHTDVANSDLIAAIKENWSQNTIRP